MPEKTYTLTGQNGQKYTFVVRRDKRLKKSLRWKMLDDNAVEVRAPQRLPKGVLETQIALILLDVEKRQRRAKGRTDDDLQKRAKYINKKYFRGKMEWTAIRWVGNMKVRLGSFTSGGVTDGHIRISDKIKDWPQFVIDYVIAHELVHRLHPNHSKEFWATLTAAYPKTERARGFIQGLGFAEGRAYDDGD